MTHPDPAQVEAAVERLWSAFCETDESCHMQVSNTDLQMLLASHAALLARAEAAEAALKVITRCAPRDAWKVAEETLAAHQPPAPVKAGD